MMMCTMDAVEFHSYGDVNFEFWNGTLFDDSDYIAKKSFLLFYCVVGTRTVRNTGSICP